MIRQSRLLEHLNAFFTWIVMIFHSSFCRLQIICIYPIYQHLHCFISTILGTNSLNSADVPLSNKQTNAKYFARHATASQCLNIPRQTTTNTQINTVVCFIRTNPIIWFAFGPCYAVDQITEEPLLRSAADTHQTTTHFLTRSKCGRPRQASLVLDLEAFISEQFRTFRTRLNTW